MFRRILVPLDGSALAEQALGPAAAIARGCGASLDVVHVLTPLLVDLADPGPWNRHDRGAEDAYLANIVRELASGAALPATYALLQGPPAVAIRDRADEIDADLMVVTSHGRSGLSRMWIGSVADGIARRSRIPVLMLRPLDMTETHVEPQPMRHVLIALDGSQLAAAVIEPAIALARATKAKVTVMRVVEPIPELPVDYRMYLPQSTQVDWRATEAEAARVREEMKRVAADLTSRGVSNVTIQVSVATQVAKAILEFADAQKVDVIAFATHGRGVSRLFIGAVADKLRRGAGCAVLQYRPAGIAEGRLALSSQEVEEHLPAMHLAEKKG